MAVVHTSYTKSVTAGAEELIARVTAPSNIKPQVRIRVHNTSASVGTTVRLLRAATGGTTGSLTFVRLASQETETTQTTANSITSVTAPGGSPVELDVAWIPANGSREFRPLEIAGGTTLSVTGSCTGSAVTHIVSIDVDE